MFKIFYFNNYCEKLRREHIIIITRMDITPSEQFRQVITWEVILFVLYRYRTMFLKRKTLKQILNNAKIVMERVRK